MFKRILIPSDASNCSELAVESGLALAKQLGASVSFLYAVEDPPTLPAPEVMHYRADLYAALKQEGQDELATLQNLANEIEVPATTILAEHERPADAINVAEEEHDLVVMATHGRRGFNRFMFGSVAELALRRSKIPYLLIRAPEVAEPRAG